MMAAAVKQRRLERPRNWINRFFSHGKGPAIATVRKWVDTNLIEGEWIAGECWVYADQTPPRTRQRPTLTGVRTIVEPTREQVLAEYVVKLRNHQK